MQGFYEIGNEIIDTARSRLYMAMPYMDVALSVLRPAPAPEGLDTVATDTERIYFDGKWLAGRFRRSGVSVNRMYLHIVLHCILRHPFKAKGKDAMLWDIACDAAVESIIDDLKYPCLNEGTVPMKQHFWLQCQKAMPVLTAEGIYRYLRNAELTDDELKALWVRFTVDDHGMWSSADEDNKNPGAGESEEMWSEVADKTMSGMETMFTDDGAAGAGLVQQLRVSARNDVDYRAFLRRFAAPREVMKVDGDAFDYVYYTYGLRLFGNMPLVEPPETREEKRIEELVIAVDTSMSTNGALVKEFLACTYGILRSIETFTDRVEIHIVQCDDRVRSDVKIERLSELRDYMEHFELNGGSTTDFRPVFSYIEEMQASGRMNGLRGLIFFTDGMGKYPEKRPPYETAFVMLEEPPSFVRVPAWAIKLVIDTEGLERAVAEADDDELQELWDELPRT